jgi:CysZ protein
MKLFQGMAYNYKGLVLGLKTPSLLFLGLTRFAVIFFLTLAAVGLVLAKYQEIANLMWTRPESPWLVWLWHLVSWLLALLLTGLSSIVAFIIAQLLFSALIMDYMSRITERKINGTESAAPDMPWISYLFYLIKQEIPRAALPVCISLILFVIGWFTPLSPVLTVLSPLVAGVFLAWDNTDLVPARRMEPLRKRFRMLRGQLSFHLGFGLCFLIPALNMLFLSFAPVGATLYYLEHLDSTNRPEPGSSSIDSS